MISDAVISPLANRLGLTLLHTLWQGFAIALLLAVANRLLRRAAPEARHAAACLAILLLPVSAAITFCLVPPGGNTAAISSTIPSGNGGGGGAHEVIAPGNFRGSAAPSVDAPSSPDSLPPAAPSIRHIQVSPPLIVPWLPAIAFAWIAGMLGFSVYRIGGWISLNRLIARASAPPPAVAELLERLRLAMNIAAPVRLLQSATVNAPCMIGWLRPVILVPLGILADLPPDQLRAILAHELAHIRRHDYPIHLLQTAIETLLFYHPAIWWISRQVRDERENCCDDIAAKATGSPIIYARALASLQEMHINMPSALAANGGRLMQRIRRILSRGESPRPAFGTVLALLLPLVMVLLPLMKLSEPSQVRGQAVATTAPSSHTNSLEVRCIDTDGKPVAGAQVYLLQELPGPASNQGHSFVSTGHSILIGPLVSDESGEVRFENIPGMETYDFISHRIYARVPGKFIGMATDMAAKNDPIWPKLAASLDTMMYPVAEYHGNVMVPPGFKPRDVAIHVEWLGIEHTASSHLTPQPLFPRNAASSTQDFLAEFYDVKANADGTFVISELPQKMALQLDATGPGLAKAYMNVPDFREPPNKDLFFMRPEAVVHGRVMLPNGQPAAKREIYLLSPIGYEPVLSTITDADGGYTFDHLSEGTYIQDSPLTPDYAVEPLTIPVKPGDIIEKNWQLRQPTLVSGLVMDPDGKPLAGAAIAIRSPIAGQLFSVSMTDANGRYTTRLADGQWLLDIQNVPPGYGYPAIGSRTTWTTSSARIFSVPANTPAMDGPTFVLQPAPPPQPDTIQPAPGTRLLIQQPDSSIPAKPSPAVLALATTTPTAPAAATNSLEVRCIDTDGKTVAGAQVYLLQQLPEPTSNQTHSYVSRGHSILTGPLVSDESGKVRFEHIVGLDTYDSIVNCVYARVPGKLVGMVRDMAGNPLWPHPASSLDAIMNPIAQYNGHVNVPPGFKPQDVTVHVDWLGTEMQYPNTFPLRPQPLFPRDERDSTPNFLSEFYDAKVNTDGTFVIPELPRNMSLRLHATGPGLTKTYLNVPDHSDPPNDTFEMRREAVVQGRVILPNGQPAAKAEIYLLSAMPTFDDVHSTITDADGGYAFDHLSEGTYIQDVPITPEYGVEPITIQVKSGGVVEKNWQLRRPTVVTGLVTDPNGKPLAGAAIAIRSPIYQQLFSVSPTNADGRYTMRLVVGDWLLDIQGVPPGYAFPPRKSEALMIDGKTYVNPQKSTGKIFSVPADTSNLEGPTFVLQPAPPPQPALTQPGN